MPEAQPKLWKGVAATDAGERLEVERAAWTQRGSAVRAGITGCGGKLIPNAAPSQLRRVSWRNGTAATGMELPGRGIPRPDLLPIRIVSFRDNLQEGLKQNLEDAHH